MSEAAVKIQTARRSRRWLLWPLAALLLSPFLMIFDGKIPVRGASRSDWNPQSFWYEPWGRSGVHKGIDIFAATGTPVLAAQPGIVLFRGQIEMGGAVVLALGPQWRLHYYAHLSRIDAQSLQWLSAGEPLGAVGSSGNAAGKPPHLHYSVVSIAPLPWRFTRQTQGWKRMFFIDPAEQWSAHSASARPLRHRLHGFPSEQAALLRRSS